MFGVYFLVVGDVSGKMKKGKGERKWRLQQRTGRAGGRRACGSPERTAGAEQGPPTMFQRIK
jgi:hypothetical protein